MPPMHELVLFVAHSSSSHVPTVVDHKAQQCIKKYEGIIHQICKRNSFTFFDKGNSFTYKLYELLWRHFSISKIEPSSCHYLYNFHTQTEYVKLNRDYSRVYIFWRYVPTA